MALLEGGAPVRWLGSSLLFFFLKGFVISIEVLGC